MALDYEIRDDVLWFVTRGDVDYPGGIDTLSEAIAEVARRDSERRWDVVFDIRESTERRSARELRGIADFIAGHDAVLSGRCAIVAGDAFHYGLGRMFAAFSESHGISVEVVRDIDEVEAWLASRPAP